MSTSQNQNNNEPKFNEYQAYEELRYIFVIAIETQDFSTLEARIAAWENKYPLADFTDPEIIRKIKAILNKDFLSRLIGDYLAAKILHEQEKQKEMYDSLKEIIDKAKKTKDYKTAQKEVKKWKDNLYSNGYNLYGFDRLYRARICTLLLLPSKELENQDKATDELKRIKENGTTMNSTEYFEAITNWQNKYSISDFPEKLQRELNQITTEVFDSISQKRTSENAISEIENVLASNDVSMPIDAISAILSKYDYTRFDRDTLARIDELNMIALSIEESTLDGIAVDLSELKTLSPSETGALSSLKGILKETPHDMDRILNWIYVNRKIGYSELAREKIIKQFAKVGYEIPTQSSFAIPDINPSLDYKDTNKIDDLRKNVILNYLGILSQGSKLSIEGKDNLVEAHTVSAAQVVNSNTKNSTMFLEAFDTIVEEPEIEDEQLYDDKGELELDKDEEVIYNIFIEDIIENPLATYEISPANKEINTVPEQNVETIEEITQGQTPEISSLTEQDEQNLEQAQELSTYVVVVSPILAQALEPKRTLKKSKGIERIKDL